MRNKFNIPLLFTVILFVGCTPDVADLEQAFSKKIESAFRDKSWEQVVELHHFQDEPKEAIEQLRQNWERHLEREIDSIVYEEISDAMLNRYSVGYEMEGKWYEPVPSPYKFVQINFKKKEKEEGDVSFWSAGIGKLVSIEGRELVFPGMKLMDAAPKPLKVVLPDKFVGEFSVVWLESGSMPRETKNFIIYEIPEGGELEVDRLDHFMQDRPVIVEYQDGTVIFADNSDTTDADGIYYDPNSKSMTAGRIGAADGTSSSEYFGTKLSWEIKKNEPDDDDNG